MKRSDEALPEYSSTRDKGSADTALRAYFRAIAKYNNIRHEAHVEMAKGIQEARAQIIYVCMHDGQQLSYRAINSLEARVKADSGFASKVLDLGKKNNDQENHAALKKFYRSLAHLRKLERRVQSASAQSVKEHYLQQGVSISSQIPLYMAGWDYLAEKMMGRNGRTEQEVALIQKIEPFLRQAFSDYIKHRNRLCESNLRLTISIARRYQNRGLALADLISEGNLGLLRGAERYDYKKGYKFSTYATWWIIHAVQRSLSDKVRTVRMPAHMIHSFRELSKTQRILTSKLGRLPTEEEVSKNMGVSVEKVRSLKRASLIEPLSLDRAVSEHDNRTAVDFVEDTCILAAGKVEADDTHKVLHRGLEILKPIEADILRQRFGLESVLGLGGEEMTLKEIGEKYHLSRERVRQIQNKALKKMRHYMIRQEISE